MSFGLCWFMYFILSFFFFFFFNWGLDSLDTTWLLIRSLHLIMLSVQCWVVTNLGRLFRFQTPRLSIYLYALYASILL